MLLHHENPIMRILKLSYLHLPPSLKSCFSYCAIFPKDFRIEKETLISLWMAQGYVEPLSGIQSIEDTCEEYFLILLRRCFFQDVEKDSFGDITYCKMHDLVHDMALEVARNEICIVDSTTSSLDKRVRHVSDCVPYVYSKILFIETGIRTFLGIDRWRSDATNIQFPVNILMAKWMCLRVLDLGGLGLQFLPEDIGNLLHLRYLDVSSNGKLKKLPKSITRLHYLQALKISRCYELEELPKDFSKLVKLRLLDVEGSRLNSMPSGMAKLTCLRRLSSFLVSERNSSGSKQHVSNLEDLRALRDLKGSLRVRIKGEYNYVKEGSMEGGYLRNKEYLHYIWIEFEGRVDGEEALLEELRPHRNVKGLTLLGYDGVRIPAWGNRKNISTFLPNLVQVRLHKSKGLQELPTLSRLQHLKFLELSDLEKLEYMEMNRITSEPSSVAAPLFPSLEKLWLNKLPNVKEWNRGSTMGVVLFPCLSALTIEECPELACIIQCPKVEDLRLRKCNERLRIMMEGGAPASSLPPHFSFVNERDPKLRKVEIDNVKYLKKLPMWSFQCLSEMKIVNDREMERLSEVFEVGEMLHTSLSSFRYLALSNLPKLTSICGGGGGVGLHHLTALETLELFDLPSLNLGDEEKEEKGMPWRCLHRSLRHLHLINLPKVVNLPKGMQHLTSLQFLSISHLNLETLPEWIAYLSSLQQLVISDCKKFESLPGSMQQLTSLQSLSISDVNLEALPKWIASLSSLTSLFIDNCKRIVSLPRLMQQLTSLTSLHIYECSERLYQRCQSSDGEDWPLIHHIPDATIDMEKNPWHFFSI